MLLLAARPSAVVHCCSTLNHRPLFAQGDLLLLAAGPPAVVHRALDRVRQFLARALGLIDDSRHCLLWVTGARCLRAETRATVTCQAEVALEVFAALRHCLVRTAAA